MDPGLSEIRVSDAFSYNNACRVHENEQYSCLIHLMYENSPTASECVAAFYILYTFKARELKKNVHFWNTSFISASLEEEDAT